MNIVIIGDADSIFVKDFIERVLVGKENNIYLITYKNSRFKDYYDMNNVKGFEYGDPDRFGIKTTQKRREFIDLVMQTVGKIDVLHVHYFDRLLFRICRKLWDHSNKRVITFWGDDILCVRWQRLLLYKPILKQAHSMNVMTDEMLDAFIRIYGKKLGTKVRVLDFGAPMYESISEVKKCMTQDECKAYWGIQPDSIAISVGYNGVKTQHHNEMIRELVKLPETLRAQITVILHFGYGYSAPGYLSNLEKQMEEVNINYIVIERFLDKKEIAILRLCADIFLYGQTTDALSSSFLEYMYAGAVLIKPTWLKHSILERNHISYIEYGKFEELTDIVSELLQGKLQSCKEKFSDNPNKLWNMNSWEKLVPEWEALYK